MKQTALLIPLTISLSACGPITPVEGTWTFSDLQVLEDTCTASDEDASEPEDLLLTLALTDDGFTFISTEEDVSSIPCTLDGNDFTCDIEAEESSGDAFTMTIDYSLTGTFSSSTEATSAMGTFASCEGEGCSMLEEQINVSLPCSIQTTSKVTADEQPHCAAVKHAFVVVSQVAILLGNCAQLYESSMRVFLLVKQH